MTTLASATTPTFTPGLEPAPPDVLHDVARLQEILDLDLTSPLVDAELTAMAAAAAAHFGLPIALVSIVLDEAQFIAAGHGLDGWVQEARGTPVEWSFCRYAVRTREPVVIENALHDARAVGNPVVAMDGVRCYAGVPLISANGHALGSFCVIGGEARTFSEPDLADLRAFATRALAHIEARRVTNG